jgi:DNA-binding NarL/FixJ family response regulator
MYIFGDCRQASVGRVYYIACSVTYRVLIADDSAMVRDIIKTFLEERNDLSVCGEAANGREAVEKALALKPDVVLLDLSMPELNGAEAASIIKQACPHIRIILFTMFSEHVGKSLTSAIGVDAVLSKPEGMKELVKTIEDVFADRTWEGDFLG